MYRRILSIDGGGIKGVFPASFLAAIEDIINDRVSNYFDLIVGTSTGGIIALGLGLGLSANEILTFYETLGPNIFKGNRFIKGLRQLGFSKYSQNPLRQALENEFKEKKLGDSDTRLVIPSLNLETGKVHIYKTSHHPRFEYDYKEKVVDVALATAAAPTYFPTFRSTAGIPLVDGGLFANNPVGLAVVEAIGILNWPKDSLKVLSIGCTTEAFNIDRARFSSEGLLYWAKRITSVFMTSQSSLSLGTAQILVGNDQVIRINPVVPHNRFSLDYYSETASLKGLGYSEAREAIPVLLKTFFSERAEEFTPFKAII